MITVRKSDDRGHFDHGWLDTQHTFSFSEYHDPRFMGFRTLRVINEDRVAPGQGFGTHPHRDMEIVTYVLEGGLAHRDSLGTGSVLGPGEFQRITAGTGVTHSEFNASDTEPAHFYQIWLLPDRRGRTPGYEQKRFDSEDRHGRLALVASPDGRDDSLSIGQDARIFLGLLSPRDQATQAFAADRHGWLQVMRGRVAVGDLILEEGDGAAISEESSVAIQAETASEVMLFDLA